MCVARLDVYGACCLQDLSQAEVWQQHHSQVQQYQQEYDRVEQLTRAVHAALTAADCMGYSPWSPEQPTQQQQQQQQQQDAAGIAQHAGQDNPQQQLWLQEPGLTVSIQWQAVEAACLGSSEGDSSSNTTRSSHSTRGSSLTGSVSGDGLATLGLGQVSGLDTLGEAAHAADAHLPPAGHGSVDSHSTARDAAAAITEVPQDSPSRADEGSWQHQSVQTDEQWPSAPLWSVADYEEEVRQLSEQLQVGLEAGCGWSRLCPACVLLVHYAVGLCSIQAYGSCEGAERVRSCTRHCLRKQWFECCVVGGWCFEQC